MDTVNFGRVAIEIPTDCPDRSTFRDVVTEEIHRAFGNDKNRMAYAAAEYERCQTVPEPFAGNLDASNYYSRAQMAMSPAAQQWEKLEHSVTDRFSDFSMDDGEAQAPAIPGWRCDAISARVEARAQTKAQDQRPEQSRSWRLDQMKVVEPKRGNGRGR